VLGRASRQNFARSSTTTTATTRSTGHLGDAFSTYDTIPLGIAVDGSETTSLASFPLPKAEADCGHCCLRRAEGPAGSLPPCDPILLSKCKGIRPAMQKTSSPSLREILWRAAGLVAPITVDPRGGTTPSRQWPQGEASRATAYGHHNVSSSIHNPRCALEWTTEHQRRIKAASDSY
jgi:hypothetical protein